MLRIGLTGGIGSGKSTVARLFAVQGVPVIDADEIAHHLTRPGEPATLQILAALGPGIAAAADTLDRKRLAERVFSNEADRQKLQAILHPAILAAMDEESIGLGTPYCLLVIPLLVESGLIGKVDRVLVVDADEAVQMNRVRNRDQRSEQEIRAIFSSQASRADRLAAADDVISNNGDPGALESQVDALHRKYLELASSGSGH